MIKGRLIGLYLALAFMAVKLIAWGFDFFVFEPIHPYVFFNMACLTVAIALGLYFIKIKTLAESNLLLDIKNAMAVGMIYTVLIVGFLYVFYAYIHPNYSQHLLQERKEFYADKKNLAKLRQGNEEFRNKSDKEIREMEIEKAETILNPRNFAIISLLAMTLWSMLNSALIAIIYRRILFRNLT